MGSRETPSALRKGNKTVRFSDTLVNTDELDNHQVLQLHRRVLDEQDESLDRLSESIRNQRELSIQIGDELDSHVQLLDEVDVLVDRHQDRLGGAKKRLNSVAQTAKDHGTCSIYTLARAETSLSLSLNLADAKYEYRKSGRHCYPHHYLNPTHCCYQIV